ADFDFEIMSAASVAMEKVEGEAKKRNLDMGGDDPGPGDFDDSDDNGNDDDNDNEDSNNSDNNSGRPYYGVVTDCKTGNSSFHFPAHPESITIKCSSIFTGDSYESVRRQVQDYIDNTCKSKLASEETDTGSVEYLLSRPSAQSISNDQNAV